MGRGDKKTKRGKITLGSFGKIKASTFGKKKGRKEA